MEITISDVLSTFSKISGVSSVAIVSLDGFVIESTINSNINEDALGAVIATEFSRHEELGAEMQLGSLNQYVMEFADGNILLVKIEQGILAVFSKNSGTKSNIHITGDFSEAQPNTANDRHQSPNYH